MSLILVLGKCRHEFGVILSYIASSRPTWVTRKSVSNKQTTPPNPTHRQNVLHTLKKKLLTPFSHTSLGFIIQSSLPPPFLSAQGALLAAHWAVSKLSSIIWIPAVLCWKPYGCCWGTPGLKCRQKLLVTGAQSLGNEVSLLKGVLKISCPNVSKCLLTAQHLLWGDSTPLHRRQGCAPNEAVVSSFLLPMWLQGFLSWEWLFLCSSLQIQRLNSDTQKLAYYFKFNKPQAMPDRGTSSNQHGWPWTQHGVEDDHCLHFPNTRIIGI